MLFIPYSYGDKYQKTGQCGYIGYKKCSNCGKMAVFALEEGTLQNHVDKVVPLGRKRDTYMLICSSCDAKFIPKDEALKSLLDDANKYPMEFDYDGLNEKIDKTYSEKTALYLTPEQELVEFPQLCIKKLAKGKLTKDLVAEAAVAYVYNKEWPKTKAGKKETNSIKARQTAKTIWAVIVFVLCIFAFLAYLSRK